MNESTGVILNRLRHINSETVQLHGSETPLQCDELKSRGITVIKVFSISDAFDFAKTKEYQDVSDYFLFDTRGTFHGGNGTAFNWNKLEQYDQSIPFFLSGGLNPENVTNLGALDTMNIHALDINSGVEVSPGIKNIDKIKSIMSCLK